MSILALRNIYKSYDGKNVLNGINLRLEKGTVLGLIGANGQSVTATGYLRHLLVKLGVYSMSRAKEDLDYRLI